MMLWRAFTAELEKLFTLVGVWIGIGVALLGSLTLAIVNGLMARNARASGRTQDILDSSPFEAALAGPMLLVTVAAVIVGVLAISTEYSADADETGGGRQIAVTLAAVPRRGALLAAKCGAITVVVAALAWATLGLSLLFARVASGDEAVESVSVEQMLWRTLGATLYWVLMALIACSIAAIARNGAIPLIVLITNSSVVSLSFLLSTVTPIGHWLPDMAGRRLFGLSEDALVPGGLDALPGALVMFGWAGVLLVIAGVLFARRDA